MCPNLLRSDLDSYYQELALDVLCRLNACNRRSSVQSYVTFILQEAESQGKYLVFHTGPGEKYKANAAVLVCGVLPTLSASHTKSCIDPMSDLCAKG